MIVWGILPIVGIVQVYFGYRLYKKIPETIGKAIIIDVFAIILFGIDIVISFFEGILIPYPDVIGYFGVNILLVILLNMAFLILVYSTLDLDIKTRMNLSGMTKLKYLPIYGCKNKSVFIRYLWLLEIH